MNYGFPLSITANGNVDSPDYADHVAQMIQQLIFTAPGERVNRPTFGTGIQYMVFEGIDIAVAAATQAALRASLQQWLGDVIEVRDVTVDVDGAALLVTVTYTLRRTGQSQTREFSA